MTTRWSYKVVEVKSKLFGRIKSANVQDSLAQLGARGRQWVSVVPGGSSAWLFPEMDRSQP